MSGRINAVTGAARHPSSSQGRSGVGPAMQFVHGDFVMPMGTWTVRSHLELGALPTAVPCVRLHTKHVLWEWGRGDLVEASEQVVAELATNAIEATAGRLMPQAIRLRLSGDGKRVLIEVWDADPRPPIPNALDENGLPSLADEGGRGLFLVEALSKRWSWYPTREWGGKVVWAEIAQ